MKKVIFVCLGNIFRSPIAKALFNKYKSGEYVAESYGVRADKENYIGTRLKDLPQLSETLRMLKEEEGIDNSEEVSKQLNKEIADQADKIIYLDKLETMPDYLKNSPKVKNAYIPDLDLATYETSRETKEKIKNLILSL